VFNYYGNNLLQQLNGKYEAQKGKKKRTETKNRGIVETMEQSSYQWGVIKVVKPGGCTIKTQESRKLPNSVANFTDKKVIWKIDHYLWDNEGRNRLSLGRVRRIVSEDFWNGKSRATTGESHTFLFGVEKRGFLDVKESATWIITMFRGEPAIGAKTEEYKGSRKKRVRS